MTDTPPDRLSVDPRSPFYNEEALAKDVGIRFKGVEKTNIEEYCVSENWVRVSVPNSQGPPRQSADAETDGNRRALLQDAGVTQLLHPHSWGGCRPQGDG